MPQRIRQFIYRDAVMLEGGQTRFGRMPSVYVQRTKLALDMLQSSRDWVKAKGMQMAEIKTGHDGHKPQSMPLSTALTNAQPSFGWLWRDVCSWSTFCRLDS